jgi:hypothetical protein
MRKSCAAILGILLLCLAAHAGPTAGQVVSRMKASMAGVKDYSVRAVMTVESPTVHVRDSRFRVYYRAPDKLHIEPEGGFALVPKGTYLGNPFEQISRNNVLTPAGEGRIGGKDCWLLRVVPKTTEAGEPSFTLWVEKSSGLVLASRARPAKGARIEVKWSYVRVDGRHWLPSTIKVDIAGLPAEMTREHGGPFVLTSGKANGRAEIRFSGYSVNRGVPDAVFRRNERK